MRRTSVISRFRTLVWATLVCLVLASATPFLFGSRAIDEPFSGSSVLASPRDLHVIVQPTRLSVAPDLTLGRGVLYADGNAALGALISKFVLDGPVFYLNASGIEAAASKLDPSSKTSGVALMAPLLDQFIAMSFDVLTIRRGTLHIMTTEGASETIADIQAEISGQRKGVVTSKGSFTIRGHQLAFDATLTPPADKRERQPWTATVALKGSLVEATFDGSLDVAENIQLTGRAEMSSPSLRKIARWFGIPIPNAHGLNSTTLKGQLTWARKTVTLEKVKASIDGNEATGTIALTMGAERPAVDGTLAFNTLDLTPYFEALRSQSYVFDRQTWSWSSFDLSFPIMNYVDADLRLSASALALNGFTFGRTAASVAVRAGKLTTNVAELELPTGTLSGRATADVTEFVPRYTLRGKVDNFDAAPMTAISSGVPVLAGRATWTVDLMAAGQTPAEVVRSLSGRVGVTMSEPGRLGLDLKGLRASLKKEPASGWGGWTKSYTNIDSFEARGRLVDGVLFADHVGARAGGLGIAATGSADLFDRTVDVRVGVQPVSPDKSSPSAEAIIVRGFWAAPSIRNDEAPR